MPADSEKPNITGGIWMKYCTVAKSYGMGRDRPISVEVTGCARVACALQPSQSGRHSLESKGADHCANDAFLTSLRATLTIETIM